MAKNKKKKKVQARNVNPMVKFNPEEREVPADVQEAKNPYPPGSALHAKHKKEAENKRFAHEVASDPKLRRAFRAFADSTPKSHGSKTVKRMSGVLDHASKISAETKEKDSRQKKIEDAFRKGMDAGKKEAKSELNPPVSGYPKDSGVYNINPDAYPPSNTIRRQGFTKLQGPRITSTAPMSGIKRTEKAKIEKGPTDYIAKHDPNSDYGRDLNARKTGLTNVYMKKHDEVMAVADQHGLVSPQGELHPDAYTHPVVGKHIHDLNLLGQAYSRTMDDLQQDARRKYEEGKPPRKRPGDGAKDITPAAPQVANPSNFARVAKKVLGFFKEEKKKF